MIKEWQKHCDSFEVLKTWKSTLFATKLRRAIKNMHKELEDKDKNDAENMKIIDERFDK